MATRKHVPIAPAINEQPQDQYGHNRSGPVPATWSSRSNLNITAPPMSIPGSKASPIAPRALPPPTHINHDHPSRTDLGWAWANLRSEMKAEPTSRPVSPGSISAFERRDSQRSLFDEDIRRRKSSTSTIASMRSPLLIDGYDGTYRDPIPSPSGHSGDSTLNNHRQSISHAYDDMLKRKIGGTNPRQPKPSSFDIPSRGLTIRDPPPHKPLTLRSLSLQESSPNSPRKLSSSNNPHWDPGSGSILTSPSISSSKQSYFSETRGSPVTDTFSTASSVTSYGGSMQSKVLGDSVFSRISAPPSRISRESDLSHAMMAQSTNTSSPTSSSTLYSSYHNNSYPPGAHPRGFEGPGISGHKHYREDDKSSSRSMRPPYLQEEVVILPNHHPNYNPQYSRHTNRHNMKRKGAPDSSERDGPPSQQLQQEGRRSPNPATMPYPSNHPNSYAPIQHMSSSSDRLSPSVNPLSDPTQDRNSPYLSQLAIDPVLNSTAHPYPLDAQQLAVQAAQSVTGESIAASEDTNPSAMTSNAAHVCECCPKKPKRFNTEAELRAHMNEKQYVCSYCHNRFKNKNEMERHQMSLHLRDRSWSCAALERSYEAAFHPSTAIPPNHPGHAQQPSPHPPAATDVCGYCGQHFPNPPDHLARTEHLTNVHKFGECNQSKKFWRADHFRQHLKHSHGGIPGKWTNMLEHACLKMEISPLPQSQQVDDGNHMAQQQAAQAARAAQAAVEQVQQQVQQQAQHPNQHDAHHLAPLTQYQAAQLQNATASSNSSSGVNESRRGPYPSMQSNEFGPMVGEGGNE